MDKSTCKLETCDNPVKRKDLCYGHYMKQWRYGTPEPQFAPKWEDLRGQRFGLLVVLARQGHGWLCRCDCGRETFGLTGDLNRGSKATCGDSRTHRRRDDVGYGAAHERVRNDRGPVSGYDCTDCGVPAQHWSYDHDDPDESHDLSLSANPVAYSPNPDHYSPRCVPCHKRFDLGRRDSI